MKLFYNFVLISNCLTDLLKTLNSLCYIGKVNEIFSTYMLAMECSNLFYEFLLFILILEVLGLNL